MSLASALPIACDQRLQARILDGGPDALEAALTLMERHDPRSLRQALRLVADGIALTPASFEVVAEAWDRYFHIRNLPWD
jgi:DNA-binding NarL/FixJ family response regulator